MLKSKSGFLEGWTLLYAINDHCQITTKCYFMCFECYICFDKGTHLRHSLTSVMMKMNHIFQMLMVCFILSSKTFAIIHYEC